MKRLSALLLTLALLAPTAAFATSHIGYNLARSVAIQKGQRFAGRHGPVKLVAIDHMWGNKWYADVTWPGADNGYYRATCDLTMYINLRHGQVVTRTESYDCF